MTILVFVVNFGKMTLFGDGPNTIVEARSGPWGKGPLPCGKYLVEKPVALDVEPESPYSDGLGFAWFARLLPQFATERSGFGIHPDGNVPGTKGCIGLMKKDTRPIYDWMMKAEDPIVLVVV